MKTTKTRRLVEVVVLVLAVVALIAVIAWVQNREPVKREERKRAELSRRKEFWKIRNPSIDTMRSIIRWERLPTYEEDERNNVRSSDEQYRFRDAIKFVGDFSDQYDDIGIILEEAYGSKRDAIGSVSGRAVARILITIAEKRGERVPFDPKLTTMWDRGVRTVGIRFMDEILKAKPEGYLDTISEWNTWLMAQLPDKLGGAEHKIFDNHPTLGTAIEVLLALETWGGTEHKKIAATGLNEIQSRLSKESELKYIEKYFNDERGSWLFTKSGE